MKKKVLYVFSLMFYLLIVCTILSHKIETEMYTQVEVSIRKSDMNSSGNFHVSTDALFVDEAGQHLYEIVEGTGWENAEVMQEVPTALWEIDDIANKIKLINARDYTLIESASRLPRDGEVPMIVKASGKTDDASFIDQYLVCYPEGVPETFVLPEHSQIIAQSDTAVLLEMSEPMYPFYEQWAKQLSDSMENENCRVFCVTEVEAFLKQLPWIAVLVVFLLIPVLLWIYSGVMVKAASKYRDLLLVNVGITVIFLLGTRMILGQIDFPASLMPANNIFDTSHYVQVFSLIMKAQRTLGESAQTVAMLLLEVKKIVVCIWSIGVFTGIAVIVLETFFAQGIKKKSLCA